MTFEIPTQSQIVNRIKSAVRNNTGTNPFTPNNFVGSICIALGGIVYDAYLLLLTAVSLTMPDTARIDYAERWGNLKKVNRLPAEGSLGSISMEGSQPATIPAGTILTATDSSQYSTTAISTVSFVSANILSITRLGQIATVTTASIHNLATGITVTISGADQPEYNITAKIVATASNQFEYTVFGSPATPATGTIIYSGYYGSASVRSVSVGADTSLSAGAQLTFESPENGVSDFAYVGINGLSGGTNEEDDEDYVERYTEAWQNPGPYFSVPEVTRRMQEIAGTTRVFISPIIPLPGQATIYFMRDNDANPIPDSTRINEMRAKITDPDYFNIMMNPANLFLYPPVPVVVDFVFGIITPDSATMRQSIINNLKAFFASETQLITNIKAENYTAAILNTIDSVTGEKLQNFAIVSPIGDIAIGGTIAGGTAQIGVLGDVSFP